MSTFRSVYRNIRCLARNAIPGQVVIQITNRCNALCPQCGMRSTADIPRASLSDTTLKRILDGCAARGVQAVSFTGGEPMLMWRDLLGWIDYADKVGIPFIRTGTNGFLFCGPHCKGFSARITNLAERLAATPLRNFWISLDSFIPEVHERMRGLPSVVAGIEKALPIFHKAGLFPAANLGLTRLIGGENTHGLRPEQFAQREKYLAEFHRRYVAALDCLYAFVKALGFTTVNTCYPMSINAHDSQSGLNPVYAATAAEDVVRFEPDEKAMIYKALLEAIPRHRDRLRIFSPLSSIHLLYLTHLEWDDASQSFGCRGSVDFFFIDALNGDTYPCGYRGNENLGKFWELDLKALHPGLDCHQCEWECFRDTSALLGPFLQAVNAPFKLIGKMLSDPVYRRLWREDLKYYHRCDLFDGRTLSDQWPP